jgi:hypothetical protein
VSQGIVVQEQDPLGDLPAAFFLQNVLQLLVDNSYSSLYVSLLSVFVRVNR